MSYRRIVSLVGLLVICSAGVAHAEPARRVYVGTYLHDVTNFDQRSGTYQVDIDVWAKWLGDFDASRIRIQNESGDIQRDDAGAEADGQWHVQRWRVRGTLRGEFPLHRFPFDEQKLAIVFELPTTDAELVPDLAASGMARRFSITGWDYDPNFTPNISTVTYATDMGTLENEGRHTRATRVGFSVTLHRPWVTVAVKLFMPLVLLLLIAVLALFLGPELVDPRAGIGVTVLLACFAFQFTVAGTIPDVAYLTIVDALFIVAYAITTVGLIVTVVVYFIHKGGNPRRALSVDRFFRVAIPIVTVIASAVILRAPDVSTTERDTRHPRVARPHSERSLLRVGTLRLQTPTPSYLRPSLRAGLVRTELDGERVAELAEEAPSVANARMDILANGNFRVRWRLRRGLKWSDGHALTSDDFRFALEVSPNPHVVRVETPDARTLNITYDSALAEALDGFNPLPRHALRAEARADAGFEAVRNAQRSRALPGAGAYRLVEFVANDHLVAETNRNYVGTAPSIARVEVRRFENADALSRAFLDGRIDLVAPNDLSPQLVGQIEAQRPGSTTIRPSEELIAVSPDLTVDWLKNADVRRAIAFAIDRESILQNQSGGHGSVARTPLVGVDPEGADPNAFDPIRARALLDAAGAIGRELTITHNSRRSDQAIALALEEQLEAVGLVVTLRESDATGASARAHGGLRLTTIMSDDEGDPRRYWNLARVDGRFVDGARNAAYQPDVARSVERWAHALYPERRRQLGLDLGRRVTERMPILPIVFTPELIVCDPTLRWNAEDNRFGRSLASYAFIAAPN